MSKLVTIVPHSPIHTLYKQHIMRQACGISGLAGNVANARVPRPSKAWVDGSNPSGRTNKLPIYIVFILEPFLQKQITTTIITSN